ncbi:MAG TPA: hypothetical protein VHA07_07830 [Devosia sp.]|nr:hypothetical protein [Devosia sp.]
MTGDPGLPSYFVRRPPMPEDPHALSDFDDLFKRTRAAGGLIDYRLAAPRWQFLCHLADHCGVVLHGSGNPSIAEFEPRKSDDVNAFGDRKAVYAAGDGLWAIYYAILDRDRFPMSLINSAMRLELADGKRSDPYYFFSISEAARAQRPYRRGTVYVLPRDTFEQQDSVQLGGHRVWVPQWASLEPVRPIARIEVGPEDFPLLAQLRGHDDATVFPRARSNPDGFPWLDGGA